MSTSPSPNPSPGTAVPGSEGASSSSPSSPSSSPPAPADVSRQIAELTDAVNRLVQAQQARQTEPPPRVAPDIGGDLPGGEPLVAAVDHARLSPLQQITLGLRDARPVGFRRDVTARTRNAPARDGRAGDDVAPSGAD